MANKRSGLVAEQRVDRNGNTVTRWVKPSTGSPASVSVPAPALNMKPAVNFDPVALCRDIMGDVRITHGQSAKYAFQTVQQALMSYPVELLERLSDPELRRNENHWDMIRDKVQGGAGAEELSEYIHFLPDLSDPRSSTVSGKFIGALRWYEELPSSTDYSKASAAVRAQCSALIRVANEAALLGLNPFHGGDRRFVLKDPELVSLVIENPDKTERIVSAMCERNSVDPDMLRSVLAGDAVPLENGIL